MQIQLLDRVHPLRIKVECGDTITELAHLGKAHVFEKYMSSYNTQRRKSPTESRPPIDYLADYLTRITLGPAISLTYHVSRFEITVPDPSRMAWRA